MLTEILITKKCHRGIKLYRITEYLFKKWGIPREPYGRKKRRSWTVELRIKRKGVK
jgi:hypothetical protein